MTVRVAINGFGRIGRAFVRAAHTAGADIEIVGINDLGSIENLAYLLQYDSVYGRAPFPVSIEQDRLRIGTWVVPVSAEKDPAQLPWKDIGVAVVVESTGLFTDYEKAQAHIAAGARRVVISAPAKGEAVTVLMGVNEEKLPTCTVSSNASCTTNATSPVVAILDEVIGIEKAILNTTHSYTATQAIVDGPSKKGFREGRAAALNMIPSSTGAAVAVTQAYTALAGKFDGISVRVPTPAGSLADITFIAKRNTTVLEVNEALRSAAQTERWEGILAVSDQELVSSDIVGQPYGSIVDTSLTRVVDGNLVKVLAWYDNEMGYAHTLVRHVVTAGRV